MTAIHLNLDLNDPAIAQALREAVEVVYELMRKVL